MALVTNHRYLLHRARQTAASRPNARILDFGCGGGQVVAAGREQGLDFYGAEVFYSASSAREVAARTGLLGSAIREIKDGKIDFENEFFNLVTSNQVFEHVEDLDGALREIHRVLKPGGALLCLFPSAEVIREGHRGIPFLHWFSRDSRVGYACTWCLRALGFGSFKKGKSISEWTRYSLDWVDKYTVYRKRRDLLEMFSQYFELQMIEEDNIRFRLQARPALAPLAALLQIPLATPTARVLFRRLVGMVILATKPSGR